MKILLKPTSPEKLDVDVLILFCFEDGLSTFSGINKDLFELIKESAQKEQFEGKRKQFLVLSSKGYVESYKIVIAGVGKKEDFDLSALYTQVAEATKKAKEAKPAKVALVVPHSWMEKFEARKAVRAIVETASLSSYQFTKYKGEEERKKTRKIEEYIVQVHPSKLSQAEDGLYWGQKASEATVFARDLINEPAHITTPSYLSDVAEKIAKESGEKVSVKVLEEEDIKKIGMEAFLAVGKGSDEKSKFIVLKYKGKNPSKKIALIGKGVTFDTGGLSLKPSEMMQSMKLDMSGAAVVLAVFKALPQIGSKNEVIGVIPACENMPSGRALKPGDILKSMSGKTIEVLNADAEGRLTLADAISYVLEIEKAEEIIDLATLTGACMIALGEEIGGLWGNDEKLLKNLKKSGEETAEKLWHMPLEKDYRELMDSHIADIKNIQSGKFGGAIAGALFLHEFVGDTPWAHMDIAGPAYAEKNTALIPKGGAGFAVRLLLFYLSEMSS